MVIFPFDFLSLYRLRQKLTICIYVRVGKVLLYAESIGGKEN